MGCRKLTYLSAQRQKKTTENTGLKVVYRAKNLGQRFNGMDVMAQLRLTFSPYNYCQDNPVNRIDPTGMLDWHPVTDEQGNKLLEADEGDDFNSLITYLDNVGVSSNSADTKEWAGQISKLAKETNNNLQGQTISSSSGRFNNIVGDLLNTWSNQNGEMFKTNFTGYNCSPTTFNRVDKALELVYGKDVLGKLKWANDNYRHWQKSSKNSLSKEQQGFFNLAAVGVVSYLRVGYEVSIQNINSGYLQPGAILNLKLFGQGHSVIFKGYTYSGEQIKGFEYWETYGIGTSDFGNEDDWQIRKAANFY